MLERVKAFNYFGSKVSLAHLYPPPRYSRIVEPFAGGAGYALKYYDREVILYDVRRLVTDAWQYLIDTPPEEIMKLPLLLPGQDVNDLKCSRGGKLLIGWCVNRTSTPCRTLSQWALESTCETAYWSAARRKEAAKVASKIKHWKVINTDWLGLLSHSKGEATYFLDPPYQLIDKVKNQYGTPLIDYDLLATLVKELPGQVIVCEMEGADWLPFKPLYEVTGTYRRKTTSMIWLNE